MPLKSSSFQIQGKLLTVLMMLIIFAGLIIALRGELIETLIVFGIFSACVILSEKYKVMRQIAEVLSQNTKIIVVMAVVFAFLLPLLLQNSYVIHVATLAIITALVALGLNFQIGSAGMVNVAPAAFMGIGAYTSAIASVQFGLNPWVGTLLGTVMAALLGLAVGYPTLKTRGYYLALVTIALQVIFGLLIINTSWLGGANGISGVPGYKIFSLSFNQNFILGGINYTFKSYYLWFALLCLGICMWISYRLWNSRIGLAWNAIEQDQIVAATQGINVSYMKLLAFTIGGAFAGLAGALFGHFMNFVGVEDFSLEKSLVIICMVALGGMDNVLGVVLGAVFLTVLNEKLRAFADYGMFFYGIVLLIVLLSRPQGLLPKRLRKYHLPDNS